MQLCKVQLPNGAMGVGQIEADKVRLLKPCSLADVLHAADPAAAAPPFSAMRPRSR